MVMTSLRCPILSNHVTNQDRESRVSRPIRGSQQPHETVVTIGHVKDISAYEECLKAVFAEVPNLLVRNGEQT